MSLLIHANKVYVQGKNEHEKEAKNLLKQAKIAKITKIDIYRRILAKTPFLTFLSVKQAISQAPLKAPLGNF